VGSHEKRRFSGRVIAATNRPLDRLRREGHLRDDFYYRLCSDVIVVPPLRQRLAEHPGELDLLLENVVARLTGTAVPELVASIRKALARDVGGGYPWPGNVRELEQAVRRVLLNRRYRGDAAATSGGWRERLLRGIDGGTIDTGQLVCGYCALLHERHGTYEEVARRTGLDRRTVKKHVQAARREDGTRRVDVPRLTRPRSRAHGG
jgi:transcriptional regulator of acetoin/glycerol metabolism